MAVTAEFRVVPETDLTPKPVRSPARANSNHECIPFFNTTDIAIIPARQLRQPAVIVAPENEKNPAAKATIVTMDILVMFVVSCGWWPALPGHQL